MILLLNPVVFLILFAIFVGVVFFSRYISLGSMIAGFSYPGVLAIITQFDTGRPIDFFKMLFAFVIGALIIFTHRTNIERIYKGTENKFSFKKKPVQKISDNGDDDDDDDD